MKSFITVLVLLIFYSTITVAQTFSPQGTEAVVPWTTSYYAGLGAGNIQFVDSLTGISSNTQTGNFAITTDGGATWAEREKTPILPTFNSIFIISKDTLVAVRDSQYIFHSYDSGFSWQLKYDMGSSERFSNCLFFNKKHGVIFPAEGGIRVSSDLGLNWTNLPWNFDPVKKNATWSRGHLFVYGQTSAGGVGMVFSRDNGLTWSKIKVNLTSVVRFERIDAGYFVIGGDQKFYKISETGEILASGISPHDRHNPDYCYVSDDEIWSLDNKGWTSDNGWRYLTRMSFNDTVKIIYRLDIASDEMNRLVSTTFDKLVLGTAFSNSNDGVLTFHKFNDKRIRVDYLKLPGSYQAKKLFFTNEAFGFVATAASDILKTTDGGLNWRKVNTPPIYPQITSFAALNENEFIAAGYGGTVLVSTDGGENWMRKETGFQRDIVSISYGKSKNIFFCTSDTLYTTDHEWQQIKKIPMLLPEGYYTNVQFFDSLNGSANYMNGYFASNLIKTTNGGESWWRTGLSFRLYTYDPLTFGIYWRFSTGFAWLRDNTQSCIMSLKGYITGAHQNKNGVAVGYGDGGALLMTFGDKYNWYYARPGENVIVQDVFAANNRAIFLASTSGRIFKFSPANQPPFPSFVIRQSPPDGTTFVTKTVDLKWTEPYSHTPIINYQIQVALGDTNNIVINDASLTSLKYTLDSTEDTSTYFWRVRARNVEGWGDFNEWYRFRTTREVLSFTTYQTNLNVELTAATKIPDGRIIVGGYEGRISFADNPSGTWTSAIENTPYKIQRFFYNKYSSVIYALTTYYEYLFSTNSGRTWTTKSDPLKGKMIYSLAFTSALTGYAAGNQGTIFKTVDGGNTWENILYSPDTGDNYDIKTIDSTIIIAVGRKGSFTISTDGGKTFIQKSLGYSETFNRLEIDEGLRIIIRNSNGEKRISSDIGNTWYYENLPFRGVFSHSADLGNNSVMIDTLGGIFTKPFNSGEYFYQKLPGNTIGKGLELTDGEVMIPIAGGKLLIAALSSVSSNSPWHYVSNPNAAGLKQYIFTRNKSLTGVGESGRVMVSDGEGKIWRTLPSTVLNNLNAVVEKQDGEIVITGDSGIVLIFRDELFIEKGSGIPIEKNAVSISFIDKYTGFISCSDGSLFRTMDGGKRWNQQTEIVSSNGSLKIKNLKAGNNKLYIYLESTLENPGAIRSELREYDISLSNFRTIYSSELISSAPIIIAPGKFFALLQQGNKFVTGRGTLMDTLVEFTTDSLNITGFFTSTGKTFWVGTDKGDLIRMDETGKVLTNYPAFSLGEIRSILFSPEGKGIIVSDAGNIYYGSSEYEVLPPDIPVVLPKEYLLYQNYPNPFNSSTMISFQISASDYYLLEIFSSTGERVETLYSGSLEPGQYSVNYRAKALASGLYFYRLSGHGATFTKKMIHLK